MYLMNWAAGKCTLAQDKSVKVDKSFLPPDVSFATTGRYPQKYQEPTNWAARMRLEILSKSS